MVSMRRLIIAALVPGDDELPQEDVTDEEVDDMDFYGPYALGRQEAGAHR